MLDILRGKNVKKLVLIAILVLILPAFVLWGSGSIGRSKDKGPANVGLIDNRKISFADFAESLTAIKVQIIMNYFNQPKVLDTLLNTKSFLAKLAWDRLIMLVEAKKAGIKITDSEIVKFIRSHPIFSRGGSFDDAMYLYILKHNMGLEPRTFEEIVRGNLSIQRLNDQLTKNIAVTDDEIAQAYRADNDKFKIAYILFTAESFIAKVPVTEEELKKYYEERKNEFVLPAKEGADNSAAGTIASFDDVKENIRAFLAESSARQIAIKQAGEEYIKLMDLVKKENLSFEAAAAKLGLKTQKTAFFSQSEYLEGIGEANAITAAASKLSKDGIAEPVETRKGAVIFTLIDTEKSDSENFKKEKENYAKRSLEIKKTMSLENWLRGLEKASVVNIDFKDYEKYYR